MTKSKFCTKLKDTDEKLNIPDVCKRYLQESIREKGEKFFKKRLAALQIAGGLIRVKF